VRIFTISDIHVDYLENLKRIQSISAVDYKNDVLILAGDISHKKSLLLNTLAGLRSKFKSVCFVPGNHDLWIHTDYNDSQEKFFDLMRLLPEEGIETNYFRLKGIQFLPIWAWYDNTFGIPEEKNIRIWADFKRCKWSIPVSMLSEFFLNLNPPVTIDKNDTVITFSHFLPRYDFLPKRLLTHIDFILPFMGSRLIDEQIRQLKTHIHISGHLHFNFNTTVDNVQYINNALGYPHERRINTDFLLELSWDENV